MAESASLKWRVLKSLALLKRSGQIVSFKNHPFSIFTFNFVSYLIKLPNGMEVAIIASRSNRERFSPISQKRSRRFSLLVKDQDSTEFLHWLIGNQFKKMTFGLTQEDNFFQEAENWLAGEKSPIKRIYKAKAGEDRQGVDYWLIYKKKIKVPVNLKSSKKYQEKHRHEGFRNIPSLVYFPGDQELLKKLEIICKTYKKGIISHL